MKVLTLLLLVISNISAFAQSQAISQLVYEIRDPQTGSARFRQSLSTIGEYLALNVLEELSKEEASIRTVTGFEATHQLVNETPALVTILRAGLPLNAGVLRVFPDAEVGFLAMSRNEETLIAKVEYVALPDLRGRTVIISDTMLGTGGSLLNAIQLVEQYGPKKIYIITAIAAETGIARILGYNPDITIFAAAIDPMLNHKGYIIPGLGDAGDRSYGEKHFIMNDKLLQATHRYFAFINRLSQGEVFDREAVSAGILAPDCRKVLNAKLYIDNREDFVADLVDLQLNKGSWTVDPIEIIPSPETKSVVARIMVNLENVGELAAIVIIRFDSDYLITEINEVLNKAEGSYNF